MKNRECYSVGSSGASRSSDVWSLRYAGKLRHLGIGRAHRGQHVLMLIHDRDVRVLTTDGQHIAQHGIHPDRIYQPQR